MFVEDANTAVPCAIKQCKARDSDENGAQNQDNLLQEAKIMLKLRHPNVIRCIGVCVEETMQGAVKTLHVVIEFMDLGDLQHYLRVCLPLKTLIRPNSTL